MIVHQCEQNSPEWNELRLGIPTSSQFSRVITKAGKRSEQRDGYMMELLAERLLGRTLEPFKSFPMEQGSLSEAEAVAWYSLIRDIETQRVGFVTNDEGTWGASPDRLVGELGLLEIKCPTAPIHVSYLLQSGKAYETYFVQCQGQLWVCEREWTDVMSYFPDLPEALIRIEPDLKFQAMLADHIPHFSAELEQKWAWCCEQNWAVKDAHKPLSQQDELLKSLKESLIAVKK